MPGIHHVHKRKRVHLHKQKFPHPNKWVRRLDRFLLVVAVIGPLVSLPQLVQVWFRQDVSGVSIITWSAFALGAIPWVAYGIVHKEKPIVVSYCIWFILAVLIVAGVLFHG